MRLILFLWSSVAFSQVTLIGPVAVVGPVTLPSGGAIAVTQQTTCTFTSSVNVACIALGATPTAGDCMLLQGEASSATNSQITSVTQTGATWTKLCCTAGGTNRAGSIWIAGPLSGTPSTAITVSYNGSSVTPLNANVIEVRGLASCAADGTGNNNNGSSNNPTTTGVTTTNAADIVLAFAAHSAGSLSSGPTNGFIALNTPDSARFYPAYLIVSSTGTYSTGWTTGTSGVWDTFTQPVK